MRIPTTGVIQVRHFIVALAKYHAEYAPSLASRGAVCLFHGYCVVKKARYYPVYFLANSFFRVCRILKSIFLINALDIKSIRGHYIST